MKPASTLFFCMICLLATVLTETTVLAQHRHKLETEYLSRQPVRDSLENLLSEKSLNDSLRIQVLDKLIREFREFDDVKALNLAQQQLVLSLQSGNAKGEADALFHKAMLYELQGMDEESFKIYSEVGEKYKQLGNKHSYANTLNNIGIYYQQKGQYEQAIAYSGKALDIARSHRQWIRVKEAAATLTQTYEMTEDFRQALACRTLEMQAKDSLFAENKARELALLNVRFEIQQHKKEIEELRLRQRFQLAIALLVLGLITFFALVFYHRKRQLEKLNQLLNTQKEEISSQRDQLETQNQMLTKLNTLKDKIFAIIGHDLRGPLTSLNQTLMLLNMGLATEEERQKVLIGIEKQSIVTAATLENLLYWGMSQLSGEQPFKPVVINLSKLADEQMELWQRTAAFKQVSLDNEISSILQVSGDKDMLRLVIRNLIGNAIKFTSSGGKVNLSASQSGEEVVVAVRDTGVGMEESVRSRLFVKGEVVSTLGTQNERGTGLGLQLIEEYIHRHGSRIWVESEVGKGSTFYFNLPVSQ
jgi:two-component system sensor histidine kinase/response regulator